MTRYVLYNKELGVYLGSSMGMGFWSNLDPVGQAHAVSWPEEMLDVVREFIDSWDDPVDVEMVPVKTSTQDGYVTMTECVEAGLPGWNRHA
jgi:hypothetical protein